MTIAERGPSSSRLLYDSADAQAHQHSSAATGPDQHSSVTTSSHRQRTSATASPTVEYTVDLEYTSDSRTTTTTACDDERDEGRKCSLTRGPCPVHASRGIHPRVQRQHLACRAQRRVAVVLVRQVILRPSSASVAADPQFEPQSFEVQVSEVFLRVMSRFCVSQTASSAGRHRVSRRVRCSASGRRRTPQQSSAWLEHVTES